MQKNHLLLLKKLKNTESAQLCYQSWVRAQFRTHLSNTGMLKFTIWSVMPKKLSTCRLGCASAKLWTLIQNVPLTPGFTALSIFAHAGALIRRLSAETVDRKNLSGGSQIYTQTSARRPFSWFHSDWPAAPTFSSLFCEGKKIVFAPSLGRK